MTRICYRSFCFLVKSGKAEVLISPMKTKIEIGETGATKAQTLIFRNESIFLAKES